MVEQLVGIPVKSSYINFSENPRRVKSATDSEVYPPESKLFSQTGGLQSILRYTKKLHL